MIESIISANVATFKSLRRKGEKIISFFVDSDNNPKYTIISDYQQIKTEVYPNQYLFGDAVMAFSFNQDLQNKVFASHIIPYLVYVEDARAVAKYINIDFNANTNIYQEIINFIFFEEMVATTLKLKNGDILTLLYNPIWRPEPQKLPEI